MHNWFTAKLDEIIFSITGFIVTDYVSMKSSLLIVIVILTYIFMIVFSKIKEL